MDPQDSADDISIGDKDDGHGAETVYVDESKDDHLVGVGVGAGES